MLSELYKVALTSFCLALLWAAGPVQSQDPAPSQDEGWLDKSRETVNTFASTLQGELVAALQAGGAVNAIGVCRDRAPRIAASLSRRSEINFRP